MSPHDDLQGKADECHKEHQEAQEKLRANREEYGLFKSAGAEIDAQLDKDPIVGESVDLLDKKSKIENRAMELDRRRLSLEANVAKTKKSADDAQNLADAEGVRVWRERLRAEGLRLDKKDSEFAQQRASDGRAFREDARALYSFHNGVVARNGGNSRSLPFPLNTLNMPGLGLHWFECPSAKASDPIAARPSIGAVFRHAMAAPASASKLSVDGDENKGRNQ